MIGNRIRAQPRHLLGDAVAEASADDDVEVLGDQPVDHADDVLDAVLAVRVERDEHRGAGPVAGVLDAGLDGGALTEVDGVAHQVCAGGQGSLAGVVAASVVDAHDVVEDGADVDYHLGDHARFVEGGDDEPNVVVAGVWGVDAEQTTRSLSWRSDERDQMHGDPDQRPAQQCDHRARFQWRRQQQ